MTKKRRFAIAISAAAIVAGLGFMAFEMELTRAYAAEAQVKDISHYHRGGFEGFAMGIFLTSAGTFGLLLAVPFSRLGPK